VTDSGLVARLVDDEVRKSHAAMLKAAVKACRVKKPSKSLNYFTS
jgi:hypothetical protein